MISNAQKKRDYHARIGNIFPLPKVKNAKRRKACKDDLAKFLSTYFPHLFFRPFSKDQLDVINGLEIAIKKTGKSAKALPRGYGKTTIGIGACIWALLYGYRRYVVIIGPSEDHAKAIISDVKDELEGNDLLIADFPKVCYPISQLEGRFARARSQHLEGELTKIGWTAGKISLPIVKGSAVSGSILKATGITSSLRGMKKAEKRPDFVLLDDPQTRESAESVTQTKKREDIILGDILGLAGHNKTISVYMTCTVIAKGDLADRFLDIEVRPDWHGKRAKLIYAWSKSDLWDEYDKIWKEGHSSGDQETKQATKFYKTNQKEMDKGCQIIDVGLYDADVEISAIQHARNLKLSVGDSAFEAEYQNTPRAREFAIYDLDSKLIMKRANGMSRCEIDQDVKAVVSFCDINFSGLHWVLMGARADHTSFVLDYGKIPERGVLIEPNANDTEIKRKIAAGLSKYVDQLQSRRLSKPIRAAFIDRGFQAKTVHQFCRMKQATFALMPAKGYGGGQYRVTKSVVGEPGVECHVSESQYGQMFSANSDYYREQMQRGFLSNPGEPGSMSIYGKDGGRHELLADHIASETLIDKAEGKNGKIFWSWAHRPGAPNDLGDAMTGCKAMLTWFLGEAPTESTVGGRGMTKAKRKRAPRRKPTVQIED